MTRKELLRFIFWEWIEPLGSALCIALLVMKFVVALYVIPTGSMQPTLHGKGDYPHERGDRVLVNKFVYRFEDPKRWDVIVFDYPFNTIHCNRCGWEEREFPKHLPKTVPPDLSCPERSCLGRKPDFSFVDKEYIKRCTAVPGDEVSIRDGNIVLKEDGSWSPSIKTDAAQGELWVDVFDSSDKASMAVKGTMWRPLRKPELIEGWKEGGPLVLESGSNTTLLFNNKGALRGYGDKGVGGKSPTDAPLVGDVLLDIQLESFPSSGNLTLEVDRNRVSHRLEVDFTTRSWVVKKGNESLGEGRLPQETRLTFARLDGRLEVTLDGKRQGFDFVSDELEFTETVIPKIRWNGEEAIALSRLRVARDIYYVFGMGNKYLMGPEKSYVVQPGEYFAMGDNSFWSSDSRTWGPVPERDMIGKALVVILPVHRIKFIR